VKPVGARLLDGELVGKGFPWLDARETDPRNAVLIKRQDQAVPVNGGRLVEVVGHVDRDILTFLETHDRSGDFPLYPMPCLTKSPVSILTRSTVKSYSPARTNAGINKLKSPEIKDVFICFTPNYTSLKLGWDKVANPCIRRDLNTPNYLKLTSPYIPAW